MATIVTANLADEGQAYLRNLLGNMCFTSGVLAIDGTNTENVQTTVAVLYSVKGIIYSLAPIAEIDVSGLGGLPTTALADGYTQIFGFEASTDASVVTVVFGDQVLTSAITAGTAEVSWPRASTTDHTIFGAVKVVNASGSDWTLGTTDLDAASITDTYYNVSLSGQQ